MEFSSWEPGKNSALCPQLEAFLLESRVGLQTDLGAAPPVLRPGTIVTAGVELPQHLWVLNRNNNTKKAAPSENQPSLHVPDLGGRWGPFSWRALGKVGSPTQQIKESSWVGALTRMMCTCSLWGSCSPLLLLLFLPHGEVLVGRRQGWLGRAKPHRTLSPGRLQGLSPTCRLAWPRSWQVWVPVPRPTAQ